MAENAGGIYVTIDGDSSPLLVKYRQAEAESRAAGQRISGALGQGFANGVSPILTEFGRIQEAVTSVGNVALQAAPKVEKLAVATKSVGEAAAHSIPAVAALGGEIRVLSGEQSIRAVERFGVSVLGLGSIAQTVFPLFGAIAVGELFGRVYERLTKVGEAEKEATEKNKEFQNQVRSLENEVENLHVRFIQLRDGAEAGISAELEASGEKMRRAAQDLRDAQTTLHGGTEFTSGGRKFIAPAHASSDTATPEVQATQKAALELEKVQAERDVKLQELAKAKEAEEKRKLAAAKALLNEERQAFKESYDNQLADMRAAHEVTRAEELKFRQDELNDAKSRGPGFAAVATEVNRQVGTLSQEVRKEDSEGSSKLALAQVEYASELRKKAIAELEADGRLLNAATEKITKEQEEQARRIAEIGSLRDRSGQQTRRAADELAAGQGQQQKLNLEIAYESQLTHTREQEIQYSTRLADIESETLQRKLDAASADVADARAAYDISRNAASALQLQSALTAEAKSQLDLDNQKLEAKKKIQELEISPLGKQIRDIGQRIPVQLGGAVASGVTDGHIGREVANALKQTGRDILGTALTAAIKELVIKTGLQTVATNLMHAVFGASTATQATATGALTTATAAQTAAVVANTAALTASGGASVASGVASTAATAASTAATGAVAGIIGPVIGGVISGVISAAATFIGDAAIVKAVNQTTAAVLSLRTVTIGQGGPSAKPVTVQPSTSFFDSFKAGIFQSLTGAGAIPVKLVAINPFLGVASFMSIFGFASGGRPPVGMPSVVGERGPELFVPDVPGVILPSVPNSGAYSAASVLMTASAVTNSSSNAMSIGAIHLHGIASAEQFARQLPNVLKSRAPAFSPATR